MARPWVTYLLVGVIYGFLLEVMLVAAILYWPNFEENVGALKAMAPLDMLKDMVDTLAQGGVEAYVTGQHFFKGCNALGIATAVLLACMAVAGEVYRGTFEIWLARPFTRRRILLERWLGGVLAVTLPIFLTTLTIPWLLGFVDEEIELLPLILCSVHASIFLTAIYSFTFLLSTLGSNPLVIAIGVLFFTTLQFSIYLVKVVNEYSIYRWTDIERYLAIMRKETLDWGWVASFVGFCALMLVCSQMVFRRRVP